MLVGMPGGVRRIYALKLMLKTVAAFVRAEVSTLTLFMMIFSNETTPSFSIYKKQIPAGATAARRWLHILQRQVSSLYHTTSFFEHLSLLIIWHLRSGKCRTQNFIHPASVPGNLSGILGSMSSNKCFCCACVSRVIPSGQLRTYTFRICRDRNSKHVRA